MSAGTGTGFILSAPSSGAGKTTVTLGLLRAYARRGLPVRGAKSGPDYIDPRFHEAASGASCLNLDAWAMTPARIRTLAAGPGQLIIEGAMGLFDGAPPDGKGATADLARQLNLPVILIVDAAKTAQSIAPLIAGFMNFDPEVTIAGVILNAVGSPRHEAMLRRAIAPLNLRVFGAISRQSALTHPSRHLGLVQAQERGDLTNFIDQAADIAEESIDLDALLSCTRPLPDITETLPMPPPAQRIAIARDAAFAFAYPHLIDDWRAGGAEIAFFSPLDDQPAPDCDLIFLPGGYPELHAGHLASAAQFGDSIRKAATNGTQIYGECGGYMALGDGLIDANGHRHQMLGLLRLETSFATRKLHLGYRHITAKAGPFLGRSNAHEFHYATTLRANGAPLFAASNSENAALPDMGLISGSVCGSFAHIIDVI